LYGRRFQWIVWDEDGKEINRLTDKKGFSYVKSRLSSGLRRVREWFAANPEDPRHIRGILGKSLITQMRAFIGPLFIPEHLLFPLLDDRRGSLVFGAPDTSQSCFWFGFGRKVHFIVFVDPSALHHRITLQPAISRLNRQNGDAIQLGLFDPFAQESPDPANSSPGSSGEYTALAEAWKTSQSSFHHAGRYFLLQPLRSNIFAFAKARVFPETVWINFCLFWGSRSLFFGCVLVVFMGLRVVLRQKNPFLSIQGKIALAFLYAAGVPLAVVFFFTYLSIHQFENARFNQIRRHGEQVLEAFDRGFLSRFPLIETRVAEIARQLSDCLSSGEPELALLEKANHLCGKLHPDTALAVLNTGEYRFLENTNSRFASLFFVDLGLRILSTYNYRPQKKAIPGTGPTGNMVPHLEADDLRVVQQEQITNRQFGQKPLKFIWTLCCNRRVFDIPMMICLAWESEKMAEAYIASRLLEAQRSLPGMRLYAANEDYSKFFPPSRSPEFGADPHLLWTTFAGLKRPAVRVVHSGARRWLALFFPGRELAGHQLLGLIPLTAMDSGVILRRRLAIVFGLVTVFLCFFLAGVLARGFLSPIQSLQQGTRALRMGNFDFRLSGFPNDEIGLLGTVFNSAVISLSEFNQARLVHQSLFPDGVRRFGPWEITCHAIRREELPGWFLEVVPLGDDRCGILFGRLTVTGPTGAMLLGLMKAAVLGNPNLHAKPTLLVERIIATLQGLGTRIPPRASQFLYMVLDTDFIRCVGNDFPPFLHGAGHEKSVICSVANGEERIFPGGISRCLACVTGLPDSSFPPAFLRAFDRVSHTPEGKIEEVGNSLFQELTGSGSPVKEEQASSVESIGPRLGRDVLPNLLFIRRRGGP
jgi:hypothetical protein